MTDTLLPPPALPKHKRKRAASRDDDQPRTYTVACITKQVIGGGIHQGVMAAVVQLTGCNLWSGHEDERKRDSNRTGAMCPLWCHADFAHGEDMTAEQIGKACHELLPGCNTVVITGGEPMLQVDFELVGILKKSFGYFVIIETNGTVPLAKRFTRGFTLDLDRLPDWIIVSPKGRMRDIQIERMDEVFLVYPDYHPRHWQGLETLANMVPVANRRAPLLWVTVQRPQSSEHYKLFDWLSENPKWRFAEQTPTKP